MSAEKAFIQEERDLFPVQNIHSPNLYKWL